MSKSVADYKSLISNSMTPQLKLQNEYGLTNSSRLNAFKSFNSTINQMGWIKEESSFLTPREIEK